MEVKLDEDIRSSLGDRKISIYKGYAYVWFAGKKLSLQRYVMGDPPPGMERDHINGDRLDNRRENLRFVTHRENLLNRRPYGQSGVKGVYRFSNRKSKPWQGQVKRFGKLYRTTYFETIEEAQEARSHLVRLLDG